MFPRRLFPASYFAPRYWPQSQGGAAVVVVPAGMVTVPGRMTAAVTIPGRMDDAQTVPGRVS